MSAYTAYAERYNINGGIENVRDIIIGGKKQFLIDTSFILKLQLRLVTDND